MIGEQMEKSQVGKRLVKSKHMPAQVEVSGFEAANEIAHMLDWLRKGSDFCQFVVDDIEMELYAQDTESQLLSVLCKSKPSCETTVQTDQQATTGVVTQFTVTFPISLRVRAANGVVWRLDVEHGYHASNLDVPDEFQLRLNFTIVGHQVEA